MTSHVFGIQDLRAHILDAAEFPSQGVLAVHFFDSYAVDEVGEALDAADGVLTALDRAHFIVIEGANLDRLRNIERTADSILKLRRNGTPARDTKWKIAWRDLEEHCK